MLPYYPVEDLIYLFEPKFAFKNALFLSTQRATIFGYSRYLWLKSGNLVFVTKCMSMWDNGHSISSLLLD